MKPAARSLLLLALLLPPTAHSQSTMPNQGPGTGSGSGPGTGPGPGPILIPTRDVDVTYRIADGLTERMRWQISTGHLRVDTPTAGVYAIVDIASGHVAMIETSRRMVLETTSPGLPVPAPGPHGFTRLASDSVAGTPCTDWTTLDGRGGTTASCLTADGVLLRSRLAMADAGGPPGRGGILLEAASVTYGAIDPNVFAIPPGFSHSPQDPAPQ